MATTHEDPLTPGALRIVIATIVINIIVVALLTTAPWSDWKTGVALNVVDNALLLGYLARHRDAMLVRIMLFGLGVGFSELAADAWLVEYTRTLDYSIGGGPMLWSSPLWMPLAWEIVAVQLSYVGLWLWESFGGRGLAMAGVFGAINIPYYEEMARRINWWQYHDCRMLSFTPYYIILGEFGIAILLAVLAKRATREDWTLRHLARYRRWRGDLHLLCLSLWHHRWAYYPLKRGNVIMSQSQVGIVLFGRTYAAGATLAKIRSHFLCLPDGRDRPPGNRLSKILSCLISATRTKRQSGNFLDRLSPPT